LILSFRQGSQVLRRPEEPVGAWLALPVVGMMADEDLVTLYAPLGAVGVLLSGVLVLLLLGEVVLEGRQMFKIVSMCWS
jgi:hypothetical protein